MEKTTEIEQTLDRLGLFEGIYQIEQSSDWVLAKNVFLKIIDDSLETQKVAYRVVFDSTKETYTIHTQVLAFYEIVSSLASLDKNYEFLVQCFRGAQETSKKFFFEYLSIEFLYGFYKIWKANHEMLFAPYTKEHRHLPILFPTFLEPFWEFSLSSPLGEVFEEKKRKIAEQYPSYFPSCEDILVGMYVKSMEKSLDHASWKWAVRTLLERMFRTRENREMEITFAYGKTHRMPIHEDVQMRLGKTRLGERMLGNQYPHVAGDLEIHIVTPSLEIYLALYPGGQARRFLQDTLALWMDTSLANIPSGCYLITWKIVYTGKILPLQMARSEQLHQDDGRFRLGYSSWL